MDLAVVCLLILLNGFFAMSEMALVSARKARLQRWAEEGRPGAAPALDLAERPVHFLSTVQVGITSIAILTGALGEDAIANRLGAWLAGFAPIAPYAHGLALAATVLVITYFSVVVGELVPKQLALRSPEAIASRIARPMQLLARAAAPLVRLLGASSAWILRAAGAGPREGAPVTDEEIVVLMRQGARAGVFEKAEPALVSNILHLDEQPVGAIMTPRLDMLYLDLYDDFAVNRRKIVASPDWIVPVCRGGSDEVVGMLHTHDLLGRCLAGDEVDLAATLRAPFIIPPTLSVLQVLEGFRTHRVEVALVADEYGHPLGLVSLKHVLEAIVGELPAHGEDDTGAARRDDGSWLLDGAIDLHRFRQLLDVGDLPGEEEGDFHTLGGFVMAQLGRVPRAGDAFRWKDLRVEVLDMDRNRVDKVLVSRVERAETEPS
ncbi:MAG TPA: hemolysin family protein [Burkholderiales bacterium]